MLNLRFKSVIISTIPYGLMWMSKANKLIKNAYKHTEEELYEFAMVIVRFLAKRARTQTIYFGEENLPKNDGYIMYSNHQGKYDALGILLSHKKPISIFWEKGSADRPITRQVSKLLSCKVISFSDMKGQLKALNSLASEVKSGKRYLIFPEGGYTDNKNKLQEFKSGCFISSLKSKKPIVPVAIYDSYKAMNSNTFERVTTQVHFLEPILYEEYGKLKKNEIADLVKTRIQSKIKEIERKKAIPST